jgi:hypothetical protein
LLSHKQKLSEPLLIPPKGERVKAPAEVEAISLQSSNELGYQEDIQTASAETNLLPLLDL